MLRTKKDVDRHVQDVLSKTRTERERASRCYSISRLYWNVGDHESARHYLPSYLAHHPDSSAAHRLMGQLQEAAGNVPRALASYRQSLELDSQQRDLVLKVCELLTCAEEVGAEELTYWVGRCQESYAGHPLLLKLKEKLLAIESGDATQDPKGLEGLIAAEVSARPSDVALQVRLIRLYLSQKRCDKAYRHSLDVEKSHPFPNSPIWYSCICDACEAYLALHPKESGDSSFHLHYLLALDSLLTLWLHCPSLHASVSLSKCTSALHKMDQALQKACEDVPNEQRNSENWQLLLTHLRGQLCFHMATSLLQRMRQELNGVSEGLRLARPLFMLAWGSFPPPNLQISSPQNKQKQEMWYRAACYRASQVGFILLGMERSEVGMGGLCLSSQWRQKLHQRVFPTREHRSASNSSHFLLSAAFADVRADNPTLSELRDLDSQALLMWPDSLHHVVWLAQQHFQHHPSKQIQLGFVRALFPGLRLSSGNINSASPETLNQLDLEVFVAISLLSRKNKRNGESSAYVMVPAGISDLMCTAAQSEWWSSAYRLVYSQHRSQKDHLQQFPLKTNMGNLRSTLQWGLEVVRCLGNHGIDIHLIVQLARTLVKMARSSRVESESSALMARACHYWRVAIEIIQKLSRGQGNGGGNRLTPKKPLFDFEGKGAVSAIKMKKWIEEGKLFLGCRMMEEESLQEALELFQDLHSPEASLYVGNIFQRMAQGEGSENREQYVALLKKARDALYLTSDRLRAPGSDQNKQSLSADLEECLGEVERLLGEVEERDVSNGRPVSASSLSEDEEGERQGRSFMDSGSAFSPVRRGGMRRNEVRPSPERLDAQVRSLAYSQDTLVKTTLEQHKAMLDLHRTVMEEQKQQKETLENIKKLLESVVQQINQLGLNSQSSRSHLPEEEPSEDYFSSYAYRQFSGMRGSSTMLYGGGPPPPPSPGIHHAGLAAAPMYFPATPQLPHSTPCRVDIGGMAVAAAAAAGINTINPIHHHSSPGLAYYHPAAAAAAVAAGALPFNEGQQFPDFPFLLSHSSGTAVTTTTTATTAPATAPTTAAATVSSSLPMNVVITSSEKLPLDPQPAPTQTLSVTVPPHHRVSSTPAPNLASVSAGASPQTPHAFQISMPPQAQIPTVSPLEKKGAVVGAPALPITTQSLLSSVPLPVISAVKDGVAVTSTVTTAAAAVMSPSAGETTPYSSHRHNSEGDEPEEVEEEHDPCPDFKPIVPLPAEVELKTGEEDEEVLFEERARLYRYVEKEWKERGTGQLKILRNPVTSKVRLLMRREQIFKICANHFLTPDMELQLMPKSDRAFLWAAKDFADEEVREEKLCARFKTAEQACHFKEAFESAKATSTVDSTNSHTRKSPEMTSSLKTPEKIPATKTTESTPEEKSRETLSRTTAQTVGGFTFISPPTFKPVQTEAAETKEDKPKKDKIEIRPFAGFTFNLGKTNDTSATETTEDSSEPFSTSGVQNLTFSSLVQRNGQAVGFKKDPNFKGFEGAGASIFSMSNSGSSGSPGPTGSTANATSPGAEDVVDEYEPSAEFKPVVPLPALIEVKTGEEGEEKIFGERARLYRYVAETKEWKERGVGEMKLMKSNQTGKVRLLMRREQVFKVCCNHFLAPDLDIKAHQMSDRAFTWLANDYAEGELKVEQFTVKFKTVELAKAFKAAVDQELEKLAKDSDGKSSQVSQAEKTIPFTEMFKPAAGTWECPVCYIRNEEADTTCAACSSDKPGTEPVKATCEGKSSAEALKPLSELFKPKAGSWECKSCYMRNDADTMKCPACETPNPNQLDATVKSSTEELKPLSELFKPKAGSWECKSCYMRNDADTVKCPACEAPNPNQSGAAAIATMSTTSASKFGLASTAGGGFKLPEQHMSTTGFKFGGIATEPNSSAEQLKPISELFKPKAGSWECKSCYMRNDADTVKCPACEMPNPDLSGAAATTTASTTTMTMSAFKFGLSSTPVSGGGFKLPEQQKSNTGFKFGGTGASDAEAGFPLKPFLPTSSDSPTMPTSFRFGGSNTVPSTTAAASNGNGFTFTLPTTPTSSTDGFSFGNSRATFTLGTFNSSTATSSQSSSETSSPFPTLGGKESEETAAMGTPRAPSLSSEGTSFTFGSAQKFEFTFSGVSPKSPIKSPKSPQVLGEEEDSYHDDDGEGIFFQPVVPLPDKVEVRTGEEEEEVVYSHRAKLFRFDGGEWKERGLGTMKILQHCSSGKLRLLMRREQVLKICLNHYLTPDLIFMEKDERTLFWAAQDFSDGELKQEKLAVRFKTAELAKEFKEAVKAAQEALKSGERLAPLKTTETDSAAAKGEENDNNVSIVFERRSEKDKEEAARKLLLPPNFYLYEEKEPCPGCRGCTDTMPGEEPPSPATTKSKPATPVPSLPESSLSSAPAAPKAAEPVPEPVSIFGNSSISELTFSNLAAWSPGGSPGFKLMADSSQAAAWGGTGSPLFGGNKKKEEEEKGDEGEEGEEDKVAPSNDPYFEPVVNLPELVQVKTGEEEEEVIYSQRAKVFRYDTPTKAWKERGIGELKLLHHPQKGTFRLLLRREQVHKVAINHLVSKDMELQPLTTSQTSWCWGAIDFSDSPEGKPEKLAAQFKTAELAQAFFNAVKECREHLQKPPSPTPEDQPPKQDQGEEDDEDEEEEEDEDDDDEDSREKMFQRQATLYEKKDSEWVLLGSGDLTIVYDDDYYCARIIMSAPDQPGDEAAETQLLCDHLIAMQTNLEASGKEGTWSARDYATDDHRPKMFRAVFQSEDEVIEFEASFQEGKEYASQVGISEDIIAAED